MGVMNQVNGVSTASKPLLSKDTKQLIVCALIVIAAIAVASSVDNEVIRTMSAEFGAVALVLSPGRERNDDREDDQSKAVARIVGEKVVTEIEGKLDGPKTEEVEESALPVHEKKKCD